MSELENAQTISKQVRKIFEFFGNFIEFYRILQNFIEFQFLKKFTKNEDIEEMLTDDGNKRYQQELQFEIKIIEVCKLFYKKP